MNALARTRDLLVSSRTSSFAYRETTKDVRVIASELGVAHVLEGSVRRSGKRVRVTAQLIRASDGFHLWSETYDRDFDNIIEIQEDIAINIANALQTAMDPEALALSRAIVDEQGTTAARAIGRLNEAVRIDPDFAFAQAELARSWFGDLAISTIGFALEGSVAENLALGQRHADLAIAAFGDRPGANPMRGLKARNDLRLKDAAADQAMARFPRNANLAYQAHRAYLMNGEIDKAAALVSIVSGSNLPAGTKIMAPLRQACATGDVKAAKELHGQMQSLDNPDETTQWLAAQTMGDYDLAQAQLAPLDTPEHLIELSSFLIYYHFDLARYPNLKAVLDVQGIIRPAPQPVTFGCQQWREGE